MSPEAIDALLAAGCTVEQLAAAVKADIVAQERKREAADEARRENERRRKSAEFYAARTVAFERDGYSCVYCGSVGGGFSLEGDHVHPVARGGTNDITNIVTACKSCNSSKRHSLLSDWRRA